MISEFEDGYWAGAGPIAHSVSLENNNIRGSS